MNNHRKWAGMRSRLARARWADAVDAGMVLCLICGKLIKPGQLWDIDHRIPLSVDPTRMDDPENVRPAHRSCNRRTGAAMGNRRRALLASQPLPPAQKALVRQPPRLSIFGPRPPDTSSPEESS